MLNPLQKMDAAPTKKQAAMIAKQVKNVAKNAINNYLGVI